MGSRFSSVLPTDRGLQAAGRRPSRTGTDRHRDPGSAPRDHHESGHGGPDASDRARRPAESPLASHRGPKHGGWSRSDSRRPAFAIGLPRRASPSSISSCSPRSTPVRSSSSITGDSSSNSVRSSAGRRAGAATRSIIPRRGATIWRTQSPAWWYSWRKGLRIGRSFQSSCRTCGGPLLGTSSLIPRIADTFGAERLGFTGTSLTRTWARRRFRRVTSLS